MLEYIIIIASCGGGAAATVLGWWSSHCKQQRVHHCFNKMAVSGILVAADWYYYCNSMCEVPNF